MLVVVVNDLLAGGQDTIPLVEWCKIDPDIKSMYYEVIVVKFVN
jgi:hypothetical protein